MTRHAARDAVSTSRVAHPAVAMQQMCHELFSPLQFISASFLENRTCLHFLEPLIQPHLKYRTAGVAQAAHCRFTNKNIR